MKMFEKIDFSISFSESADSDAKIIFRVFSEDWAIYYYKNWLELQNGYEIYDIAEIIYKSYPCIILASQDWFTSPATKLEAKFLESSPYQKLVLDYAGLFSENNFDRIIPYCSIIKMNYYTNFPYIEIMSFLANNRCPIT